MGIGGKGGRQSAATAPLLWILPESPCPRVAFNNCLYQSNAIFFSLPRLNIPSVAKFQLYLPFCCCSFVVIPLLLLPLSPLPLFPCIYLPLILRWQLAVDFPFGFSL